MTPSGPEVAGIVDAARNRSSSMLKLAARLVRTPSDAGRHTEAAVVTVLEHAARDLGLGGGRLVSAETDRPNLLIEIPFDGPGPRLLLTGHTDTKPPGDRAAWNADPWSGDIDGGRLLGLGSGDLKAALAAMLHAAAILSAVARPRRGSVLLAFTTDEEGQGRVGLRHVLGSTDAHVDGAIIGEPAGLTEPFDRIGLASRGFFGFTLAVSGSQVHSALGDLPSTVNPVQKLARTVAALQDQGLLAEVGHPLFPRGATVNVATTISGGVAPGVIPAWASARGDIRLLPGMTAGDALAALERGLDGLRAADPGLVITAVPEDDDWPGADIDPAHALARAVLGAASDVRGGPVPAGGFEGATEAHLLTRLGIPTVPAAGPGVLTLAHAPNEWVSTRAVVDAAAIYALAAYRFLGDGGAA